MHPLACEHNPMYIISYQLSVLYTILETLGVSQNPNLLVVGWPPVRRDGSNKSKALLTKKPDVFPYDKSQQNIVT